ncbi:MAG: nicotinate (nicotinamide) nucleotide adenylyltransferase [Christensenellaceae bacterium]
MRIGLFGGTFDPVHREHIALAKCAVESLRLDKLIVIPASIPPHKRNKKIASGEDRLAMCRLAFTDEKEEVSDWELSRRDTSFSYLTCRHFRSLYPEDELFFLMGTDMFDCFDSWKNPDDIVQNVTLAVCLREKPLDYYMDKHEAFVNQYQRDFVQFPFVGDEVSSTRLRTVATLGEDVSKWTSREVALYIERRRLYREETLIEALSLEKRQRREHSVRVATLAVEMAKRYSVSEEKALIAAAMHDCAKNLSPDSPYLTGFVPPDDCPPPVLHQYQGAYVAEHTFGVTDEDVLNAIRYHTSGRRGMSALEKLIYLADMLEEGREYPGVERLREIFRRDMDECLTACLEQQLRYLREVGGTIYPLTQQTYDWMKQDPG